MTTVTLEKVGKRYQSGESEVTALKEIDLTLSEGEFVALCGPSGSGKSSLLHIIGCLDKPTSGSVTVMGKNVNQMGDDAV